MRIGRLLAGLGSAVAVAGCAVVVIGMGHANSATTRRADPAPADTFSAVPAFVTTAPVGSAVATASAATPGTSAAVTSAARSSAAAAASQGVGSSSAGHAAAPVRSGVAGTSPAPTVAAPGPVAPAPVTGSGLPVGGSTSGASRVITVVASSYSSTTATLQAWDRAPGGGWLRYGPAIYAHVGSDGLTSSPSEFRSATPIGSFTLTQAFGRLPSPGGLPYFQTTPADWWISQPGGLYNTHQRCSGSCPFTQGDPNEHLYYETPFYNYAVVINTPSGAAAYPHGSAFFLHVTDGSATAGCVAIPQSNLVTIMRWLVPSSHPRILIGVA